eukprot:10861960-Alexandrium_andersonii.AAC.1
MTARVTTPSMRSSGVVAAGHSRATSGGGKEPGCPDGDQQRIASATWASSTGPRRGATGARRI